MAGILYYFSEQEFRAATPPCSLSDMNEDFMQRLDIARSFSSEPFVIASAFRPVSYEKSKGRTGSSSYCKGLAVSIRCRSARKRAEIVKSLILAGFTRIGISNSFIYVDYDTEKPSALFLY